MGLACLSVCFCVCAPECMCIGLCLCVHAKQRSLCSVKCLAIHVHCMCVHSHAHMLLEGWREVVGPYLDLYLGRQRQECGVDTSTPPSLLPACFWESAWVGSVPVRSLCVCCPPTGQRLPCLNQGYFLACHLLERCFHETESQAGGCGFSQLQPLLGMGGTQPLSLSPFLKGAVSVVARDSGFLKPEHPVHAASTAFLCRRFPGVAGHTHGDHGHNFSSCCCWEEQLEPGGQVACASLDGAP